MKRHECMPIGDILRQAIDECQLTGKLDECRAVDLWPAVVGDSIASQCRRPTVSNGMMTVGVTNAALRHELSMHRSALVKTINDTLGKPVITGIRFSG